MLSRFSSLFTYVILGLVVSAAATPLNPLGDFGGGGGSKSMSRPRPHTMSNDKGKPYDDNKGKSYDDDKPKPYDDDKSYDDKDRHYGDDRSERHGQCSVSNQHCCNQVNQATETAKLEKLSGVLGMVGVVDKIKDSNKLWGFDCSPLLAISKPCSNQQVCCEDNHMNGLVVVGCNNFGIL